MHHHLVESWLFWTSYGLVVAVILAVTRYAIPRDERG
jgi:hypothetical protein